MMIRRIFGLSFWLVIGIVASCGPTAQPQVSPAGTTTVYAPPGAQRTSNAGGASSDSQTTGSITTPPEFSFQWATPGTQGASVGRGQSLALTFSAVGTLGTRLSVLFGEAGLTCDQQALRPSSGWALLATDLPVSTTTLDWSAENHSPGTYRFCATIETGSIVQSTALSGILTIRSDADGATPTLSLVTPHSATPAQPAGTNFTVVGEAIDFPDVAPQVSFYIGKSTTGCLSETLGTSWTLIGTRQAAEVMQVTWSIPVEALGLYRTCARAMVNSTLVATISSGTLLVTEPSGGTTSSGGSTTTTSSGGSTTTTSSGGGDNSPPQLVRLDNTVNIRQGYYASFAIDPWSGDPRRNVIQFNDDKGTGNLTFRLKNSLLKSAIILLPPEPGGASQTLAAASVIAYADLHRLRIVAHANAAEPTSTPSATTEVLEFEIVDSDGLKATHELAIVYLRHCEAATHALTADALGEGSFDFPYILCHPSQFMDLSERAREGLGQRSYILGNNLDLGRQAMRSIYLYSVSGGDGRGSFFDGRGYKVSNFSILVDAGTYSSNTEGLGIFSIVSSGRTIRYVHFDDVSLTIPAGTSGVNYLGGVVGVVNGGKLHNIQVTKLKITAPVSTHVGGIAGLVRRQSSDEVELVTDAYAGAVSSAGICEGPNTVDVIECGGSCGGSVGQVLNGARLSGVVADIKIRHGAEYANTHVGGLVGQLSDGGSVHQSKACGNLEERLVGAATGNAPHTHSVGGLIGSMLKGSAVTRSRASGSVKGGSSIGGLVGSVIGENNAPSSIVDSHYVNTQATSLVSGYGTNVGGAVGAAMGAVTLSDVSASVGSVFGGGYVGGLVGTLQSWASGTLVPQVNRSFADVQLVTTQAVHGLYGDYEVAGGLAGSFAAGSISNSFALVTTLRGEYLGGLAGSTNSTTSIATSYFRGGFDPKPGQQSNTSSPPGGVFGLANYYASGSSLMSVYWRVLGSASATPAVGRTFPTAGTPPGGSSYQEISSTSSQASFPGFNFTNIWQLPAGELYPTLRPLAAP